VDNVSLNVESENVISSVFCITWIVCKLYASSFASATSFDLSLDYNCGSNLGCYGLGFFWCEANFAWHYGYAVFGK
jgi:hypothetical protein